MLASRGVILLRATMYSSDVHFTPAENGLIDGSYISLIPVLFRKRLAVLGD